MSSSIRTSLPQLPPVPQQPNHVFCHIILWLVGVVLCIRGLHWDWVPRDSVGPKSCGSGRFELCCGRLKQTLWERQDDGVNKWRRKKADKRSLRSGMKKTVPRRDLPCIFPPIGKGFAQVFFCFQTRPTCLNQTRSKRDSNVREKAWRTLFIISEGCTNTYVGTQTTRQTDRQTDRDSLLL